MAGPDREHRGVAVDHLRLGFKIYIATRFAPPRPAPRTARSRGAEEQCTDS
jgi:hypothetical protein